MCMVGASLRLPGAPFWGVLWSTPACPLPEPPNGVPWKTARIHPFGQGQVSEFTSGKTLAAEVSSRRPSLSGLWPILVLRILRGGGKVGGVLGTLVTRVLPPWVRPPACTRVGTGLPALEQRRESGPRGCPRGNAGVVAEGGAGRRTKETKQPPSKELQNLLSIAAFRMSSLPRVIIDTQQAISSGLWPGVQTQSLPWQQRGPCPPRARGLTVQQNPGHGAAQATPRAPRGSVALGTAATESGSKRERGVPSLCVLTQRHLKLGFRRDISFLIVGVFRGSGSSRWRAEKRHL